MAVEGHASSVSHIPKWITCNVGTLGIPVFPYHYQTSSHRVEFISNDSIQCPNSKIELSTLEVDTNSIPEPFLKVEYPKSNILNY